MKFFFKGIQGDKAHFLYCHDEFSLVFSEYDKEKDIKHYHDRDCSLFWCLKTQNFTLFWFYRQLLFKVYISSTKHGKRLQFGCCGLLNKEQIQL